MTDQPASLWIAPIKQGRETGYMVADYAARGAMEYVVRSPLVDAAPELLAACKALQMEANARGCGFKFVDELMKRLDT